MKKSISIMIGVWSLIGLIIIGLIIVGMSFYGISRSTGFAASPAVSGIVLDETIPMDNIKNIKLNMAAGDITVLHSGDASFRIVQTMENERENLILNVKKTASSIEVKPASGFNFSLFDFSWPDNSQNTVEIYIPESYSGDLVLHLSAGDLDIADPFSLGRLDIHVSAGKLTGYTTLTSKSADLQVSAGNLTLSSLTSDDFDIGTSAGKLKIDELTGAGRVSVSAGSVSVESLALTGELKANTSAGNITISLVGDPALDYKLSTSAGSIETYFSDTISGGNGKASGKTGEGDYKKLDISTSAGSIRITKA